MNVYLSSKAETKLLELANFLIEEWSHKVKDKFFERFNKKVKQISIQPNSCPKSKELLGLHKCVVTRQTTFYYRVINPALSRLAPMLPICVFTNRVWIYLEL